MQIPQLEVFQQEDLRWSVAPYMTHAELTIIRIQDCGHSPMMVSSNVFQTACHIANGWNVAQHTCFWNNEILTPIQKVGTLPNSYDQMHNHLILT